MDVTKYRLGYDGDIIVYGQGNDGYHYIWARLRWRYRLGFDGDIIIFRLRNDGHNQILARLTLSKSRLLYRELLVTVFQGIIFGNLGGYSPIWLCFRAHYIPEFVITVFVIWYLKFSECCI